MTNTTEGMGPLFVLFWAQVPAKVFLSLFLRPTVNAANSFVETVWLSSVVCVFKYH